MSLSDPAMESGASGDDSVAHMRRAKALVNCWPTVDFELLMREVQETVEVLSHQAAVWVCLRSTSCSRSR